MTETTVKPKDEPKVSTSAKIAAEKEDVAAKIAEEEREALTERRLAYADLLRGKNQPEDEKIVDFVSSSGVVVPQNMSAEPVDANGRPFGKNENGEFVDDDGKALKMKERKVEKDPAMEALLQYRQSFRDGFADLHTTLADILDGRDDDDIKRGYQTLSDSLGWFTR